jgi:K(+)-stimulated pyrophosphate-energized sodium pump
VGFHGGKPADASAHGAGAPAATSAASTGGNDAYAVMSEGEKVVFLFPSGQTAVLPGSEQLLAAIVSGVQAGKKAVVSGYVDATGNAAQNAEIAKQRALGVAAQLKALGVPDDRIELQKPADIQAGNGPMARRVEVSLQ